MTDADVDYAWIGAADHDKDGTYVYTEYAGGRQGREVPSELWLTGMPGNYVGYGVRILASYKKLSIDDADAPNRYICEFY